MNGGFYAMGPCWSCGKRFAFAPERVPSIPIDPVSNRPPDLGGDPARAILRPICEDCVRLANANRRMAGRPLIEILPGAYEIDLTGAP